MQKQQLLTHPWLEQKEEGWRFSQTLQLTIPSLEQEGSSLGRLYRLTTYTLFKGPKQP